MQALVNKFRQPFQRVDTFKIALLTTLKFAAFPKYNPLPTILNLIYRINKYARFTGYTHKLGKELLKILHLNGKGFSIVSDILPAMS